VSELTTAPAVEQTTAQHADDPFLVLLTFSGSELPTPIRVVRNREDIVSRGNTFSAYPFQISLPSDDDQEAQAKVTIANVSRRIGKALEALITPPDCLIEIVLASTPDTVERAWDMFSLTQASWDAFRVTGTIQVLGFWDEPWPYKRITPKGFPGLFP
jgi:hypothetical protein